VYSYLNLNKNKTNATGAIGQEAREEFVISFV
jgi:hypothetical protein